ncbi:ethanolamine utilization acetate kinase EutQ [Pseudomonas pseudonitroreducens]|uniref:ethanolamine utilization acetate kinase EutQ n=1 Tax=Pseudomonas pseudonitroreducens TaxID=2892326 RepID=UPI001F4625CB|nr:ethanolamine utilization acetate kinase EutQ [Pseudomonas pseudonitroreducens]
MKKLITAGTIREAVAAGQTALQVELPHCIVTPEARMIAEEAGLALIERVVGVTAQPAMTVEKQETPGIAGENDLAQIRAAVMARLPAGVDEALVEQFVRKAAQAGPAQASAAQAGFEARTGSGGIKLVKGDSVRFGLLDGVEGGGQIGITDVVGSEDGSSMGAGFMQWENAFFPWTLNYDEVDLVLEGELHIRQNGETLIGRPGDVLFIPKGSHIEFGTPSRVRFLYVAWPANWQEQ